MKKIFLFGYVVFLLCITAIPVSAFTNLPYNNFECHVQNAPAGAVYLDILIQITPQDVEYLAISERETAISADSEIARYNKDGYMSLSFHYQKLYSSDMELPSARFEFTDYDLTMDQVSPKIIIVLLNKDGNILQMSKEISTKPGLSKVASSLTYDAAENKAAIEFQRHSKNPFAFIDSLIPIRIALAAGIATLLAIPLKLRPIWVVPLVNIVVQAAYDILVISLFHDTLFYIVLLLIGEFIVPIAIFSAYFLIYQSTSTWKLAVNPLIANIASLFMTLLIAITIA